MHCLRWLRYISLRNETWKCYSTFQMIPLEFKISMNRSARLFHTSLGTRSREYVPRALRSVKPKSQRKTTQYFVDMKQIRTVGGKGGDGAISLLQLWVNDRAGPDGGDGGNGGHVIFEATANVKDFSHISHTIEAENGEKGSVKNCCGKNAKHSIVEVPIGTIVRNTDGNILGDLDEKGVKFIAARGGAGGHGNTFFKSPTNQAPEVCEYGANGEDIQYLLEVKSMAHIGLIGLPNAGKSSLLRTVSRAKPKVAPYPFTTLRPHLGMILYDDYEQIAVADLPGLIDDSHKNRGLGITFLKHVERCAVLCFVLDMNLDEPWVDLETLRYEMCQFNEQLEKRPCLVIANKMDLPNAQKNLQILKEKIPHKIIPISAKMGTNISTLLNEIRMLYDEMNDKSHEEDLEAV